MCQAPSPQVFHSLDLCSFNPNNLPAQTSSRKTQQRAFRRETVQNEGTAVKVRCPASQTCMFPPCTSIATSCDGTPQPCSCPSCRLATVRLLSRPSLVLQTEPVPVGTRMWATLLGTSAMWHLLHARFHLVLVEPFVVASAAKHDNRHQPGSRVKTNWTKPKRSIASALFPQCPQ